MSSYQFVNSLTSCYGQGRQDPTAQDYYTPPVQAYGNCYNGPASPVQQYGHYASPQTVPHLPQNGGEHHYNSCSQQRLTHPNPSHSPRTPTPSVTPVPSCKYAEPLAAAASPQDLSTTSSNSQPPGSPDPGQSPPRHVPQSKPQQQQQQQQQHLSSQLSPASTSSSPQPSPPQQSSSPQLNNGQTQQQNQQKGNSYAGNPPQIYPWMRKVHVGQSFPD